MASHDEPRETEVYPTDGERAPASKPDRASPDVEGLKRALVETGLLTAEQLRPFAGAEAEGPAALARALVRAGKLTPYQAGAVLQGKARGLAIADYLVLDKRGAGGMGVVFKALQRATGRIVALKILPPSFGREREAVLRFRREVEVAARLSHPNVVAALDASEDRGVHFLTMEFVDGHDLDDLVREVGPLPVKLALHCAIQAARGLEAAHAQGIVHRDIKPANLMLDASGAVRVLDLGLARVVAATNPLGRSPDGTLTQTGSYMGTVDYMSPEQADDSKRADHRADIYSLGCTLYYLLTGRAPFEAETVLKRLMAHQGRPAPSLHAARSDIPAALEAAYQTMMAKRPGDRPRSMAEVVELLEACRVSADEARHARAGLKSFAETVMKRAAPKKREWGADASIYARRTVKEGLQFDPDLKLEDLMTDYRPEEHQKPLAEDQLPPRAPRPFRPRTRARRGVPTTAVGVVGALGLGIACYFAFSGGRSAPKLETDRGPRPISATVASPAATATSSPRLEAVAQPLFKQGDLTAWQGLNEYWRVRDGTLVGAPPAGRPVHTFYCSKRTYRDFELRFEARLKNGVGNSGVQFRSALADANNFRVIGPQCEIGSASSPFPPGSLVTEPAGQPAVVAPRDAVARAYKEDDFNAFVIRCVGRHVTIRLNGLTTVDADFPSLPAEGIIAWQLHGGRSPEEAEFRNATVLDLSSSAVPSAIAPRVVFSDDFTNPASGWAHESAEESAKNAPQHHGYTDGMFRLDANVPGVWGWACPKLLPSDFACEVVGRVFGDRPTSWGSLGVVVRRSRGEQGFQVRIDGKGQLFVEPSFRTAKNHPDSPKLGPITHPAIRPAGKDFNTIVLRVRQRQLEVSVNGSRVCDPVALAWDLSPVRLELGVFCESPGVRAEYDKITIEDLSPSATPTFVHADALMAQGKLDDAIAEFRQVLQQQPNDALAHNGLGTALHRMKLVAEAIPEYREAIRLKPDYALAHTNLGYALDGLGKLDEAVAAHREAIRLKPDYALAYKNLAFALNKQGDLAGVAAAYRQIVRLNPQDAGTWVNLGYCLIDQGKLDDGAAACRKALELQPESAVAHNNLATALVVSPDPARRDVDEALVHARRAVELAPRQGTFFNTLGVVEYRRDRLDEAGEALATSMRLRNGGDANDWFFLAMIAHRQGDPKQARDWFDKAVAWMQEKAPRGRPLRDAWSEAAALLGQPGPDAGP